MNATATTTTAAATTTSATTATTVTAAVVVELLAWVAPCQPPCTVLSTSPGYPELAGVLPYSPYSPSPYTSSSPYPSSPYASASNSSPYSATSSTAYLDVEASDNLQLGLLNYWLNGVLTILTVVLGVLG